jgi:hypothetical protein
MVKPDLMVVERKLANQNRGWKREMLGEAVENARSG